MPILISKSITVDGVLTDADVTPVLADPTNTYGVKRDDTNAVIVPAGTAFAHDSLGRYSYNVADIEEGVTYSWYIKALVAGEMIYDRGDNSGGTLMFPAADWYYSDRAGVLTLQDVANLTIVWDQNNDGDEDDGLLENDGETADGYIDRYLAQYFEVTGNHVVDIDTAPAYIVQSLRDINNHLTVWYGWHHRGSVERVPKPNEIAGIMSGYKQYADEELAKLVGILTNAGYDTIPGGGGAPGGFEMVPIRRSFSLTDQAATDENFQPL